MKNLHWHFVAGQKKHTQDGCNLAALMKSVGQGRYSVSAIDVGCGDGIISYEILRLRRATYIVGIDILKEAVDAARLNLSAAIDAGDAVVLRLSAAVFFRDKKNWDRFDRFVINPPFFAAGSGRSNKSEYDQLARHDKTLPLNVWARGAQRLLRTGGELYCVFPTERLSELLSTLSSNLVEPKELWWFADDRRKRRVFVRAVRGAKSGVTVHFDWHVACPAAGS